LKPLTDRQRATLRFIIEHRDIHGYPPTCREMMSRFEVNSSQAIRDVLGALERKGYIARAYATARGITVLREAA